MLSVIYGKTGGSGVLELVDRPTSRSTMYEDHVSFKQLTKFSVPLFDRTCARICDRSSAPRLVRWLKHERRPLDGCDHCHVRILLAPGRLCNALVYKGLVVTLSKESKGYVTDTASRLVGAS